MGFLSLFFFSADDLRQSLAGRTGMAQIENAMRYCEWAEETLRKVEVRVHIMRLETGGLDRVCTQGKLPPSAAPIQTGTFRIRIFCAPHISASAGGRGN
jgi:hypothetical protein